MPIGIIGSLAICTILYVLFARVLTGMVNYKTFRGDASPVTTVIHLFPSVALQVAIQVGIIAGYTSVILVMLLGQSRVFYSMSRDGLLPKVFCDDSSEVADAVALQSDLHGLRFAVLGLPADFETGRYDQHRHLAGIRDRVRRGDRDAEDQSRMHRAPTGRRLCRSCRFSACWCACR